VDDKEVKHLFEPIVQWIAETVPGSKERYPPTWKPMRHVSVLIREQLLSVGSACRVGIRRVLMQLQEELLKEFVELFRGKTEEELDELAKSFLLSG
jgi:hypothetical protein